MKTFVAGVLALLLAGCATERYYPVYLSEGDGYYIAERNPAMGGYGARYDSLFALGMYPWWVHTFHSPYFYPYYFSYHHPFYDPYFGPYHFAGWYPVWPYYAGYQGRQAWGWPPYQAFRYVPPAPPSAGAPPGQPGNGRPRGPLDPPVADQPRRRALGERSLAREAMHGGVAPQPAMPYSGGLPAAPSGQPAAPFGHPAPGQPMAPAAVGRPFSVEPARGYRTPSERVPAERDH
jgi:hypothetical protein